MSAQEKATTQEKTLEERQRTTLKAFNDQVLNIFRVLERFRPDFNTLTNIKCAEKIFIKRPEEVKNSQFVEMMINIKSMEKEINSHNFSFFADHSNPIYAGLHGKDLEDFIKFIKNLCSDYLTTLWTYIDELLRISSHYIKISSTVENMVLGPLCNVINFCSSMDETKLTKIRVRDGKVEVSYLKKVSNEKDEFETKDVFLYPESSKELILQNVREYFKLCPPKTESKKVIQELFLKETTS